MGSGTSVAAGGTGESLNSTKSPPLTLSMKYAAFASASSKYLSRRGSDPSASSSNNKAKHVSLLHLLSDEDLVTFGIDALKLVINNDASRRAFIKYLKKEHLDDFFNYYFEVEDLKSLPLPDVPSKCSEVKTRVRCLLTAPPTHPDAGRVWQAVHGTLKESQSVNLEADNARQDLIQQFEDSQLVVVDYLVTHLKSFINSSFFAEFESIQLEQEATRGSSQREGDPHPKLKTSVDVSLTGPVVPPDTSTFPNQFHKILVIDDSSVSARLACLALQKNGHQCKVVNNGRKGVEMFKVEKFDVVLVDLYMPVMGGEETLKLLKELREESTKTLSASADESDFGTSSARSAGDTGAKFVPTVLIGMSADGDDKTKYSALNAGADYFMTKPISLENLSSILRTVQKCLEELPF